MNRVSALALKILKNGASFTVDTGDLKKITSTKLIASTPSPSKLSTLVTSFQFADYLGCSFKFLKFHAYRTKVGKRYTKFEVKKRNGSTREINAPTKIIKEWQYKIKKDLELLYKPKKCVHGFIKKRNIVTNAETHTGAKLILNIDIKDFFPSITFQRIRGLLNAKPYEISMPVATIIAQIACCDNGLPQGSPLSPLLSNMLCAKLDTQLFKFCASRRCKYTRYVDDITISTKRSEFPKEIVRDMPRIEGDELILASELLHIIRTNGFTLNVTKTRFRKNTERQEVTGLTVNELVNVNKEYLGEIRSILYDWNINGYQLAEQKLGSKYNKHRGPEKGEIALDSYMLGKINYLKMVRGRSNNYVIKYQKALRALKPDFNIRIDDINEILATCLWIIQKDNESQGTAFYVKNYGLITCAHVFYPDTNKFYEDKVKGISEKTSVLEKDFYAFRASEPSKKYPVSITKIITHFDLAILKPPLDSNTCFSMNFDSEVNYHDEVMLVGFPSYKDGDFEIRSKGHITGKTVISMVNVVKISQNIIHGNSGGPILDKNNNVIAVAIYGSQDEKKAMNTTNHGGISIKHLNDF